MTARDTLLNKMLKAAEQYNTQNEQKISPLQVLKIYVHMNK